jgi:hypothetical protein
VSDGRSRGPCRHCGLEAPEGLQAHAICAGDAAYRAALETARRAPDWRLKGRAKEETPSARVTARAARRVLHERELWALTQEART